MIERDTDLKVRFTTLKSLESTNAKRCSLALTKYGDMTSIIANHSDTWGLNLPHSSGYSPEKDKITDDFDCSHLSEGASISLISPISDDKESMAGRGLLLISGNQ